MHSFIEYPETNFIENISYYEIISKNNKIETDQNNSGTQLWELKSTEGYTARESGSCGKPSQCPRQLIAY
jgi:hypothetical protein